MSFTFTQKVLFKHCDPARIVFYPRYFEMINDTIEAFFDTRLTHPWHLLLESGGIPTAQIAATFVAPSKLGDVLDIDLHCLKLGRTSLDLKFTAHCNKQPRLNASSTLVYVDLSGRPVTWPEGLRAAIETQLSGDA